MKNLLLMSMIVATIALPLWLSRDPRPARGYRRLAWWMFASSVTWAMMLRYVYFRL